MYSLKNNVLTYPSTQSLVQISGGESFTRWLVGHEGYKGTKGAKGAEVQRLQSHEGVHLSPLHHCALPLHPLHKMANGISRSQPPSQNFGAKSRNQQLR